jgi:hypothetical protein
MFSTGKNDPDNRFNRWYRKTNSARLGAARCACSYPRSQSREGRSNDCGITRKQADAELKGYVADFAALDAVRGLAQQIKRGRKITARADQ